MRNRCIYSILVFLLLNYCGEEKINRYEVVSRNNPIITRIDSLSPLTVGNGNFAFTVDVTGFQTFFDYYSKGIPLGTFSNWGWNKLKGGYELEDTFEYFDVDGRKVSYASKQKTEAGAWLRANPHRFHLGRIGLCHFRNGVVEIKRGEVTNIHQKLNLWSGIIESNYKLNGERVFVKTGVSPSKDIIVTEMKGDLIEKNPPCILFSFPYASLKWGKTGCDWDSPEKHSTVILKELKDRILLKRELDSITYFVLIKFDKGIFERIDKHEFLLIPEKGEKFELLVNFSAEYPEELNIKSADRFFNEISSWWRNYWNKGAFIDFANCKSPEAKELERRVILSQYLTAIQCSGNLPPQETGLTCTSWFGKFHLEMHWWHAVHFVLWGRPELLERSLDWYFKILPEARKKAIRQGYEGVRWPKMVGSCGRESPSSVGVFLIWQQPHIIYYSELLYRYYKEKRILEKYKDLVFQTADFLASYARYDSNRDEYILGPPLIPAQEVYKPEETINPTFELAYWRYGLKVAIEWKKRLGMKVPDKWVNVLEKLSPYPVYKDKYYQNVETEEPTLDDPWHTRDHPTVLGALGMLPGEGIDEKLMGKTLKKVFENWNWVTTWGWDYPLIAMTAARLGEKELAIKALLMNTPKNRYLVNGHNYQENRLPIYLPGNGGLLTAIAMMAGGWDGAPDTSAPGFPDDGDWDVKCEGFKRFP